MKKLFLLIPLLVVGCSTGNGGGGVYNGPPELRDPIIAEIHRQSDYVGEPAGQLNDLRITAKRCDPTATNNDGPYTCDKACSLVDGCVHAWNLSSPGSQNTQFMFTYLAGGMVELWFVVHEIAHFTGRNSPEQQAESHPAYFTLYGNRVRVTQLIGGVRWPARAFHRLTLGALEAPDDVWTPAYCRFDDEGRRIMTIPENQEARK